MARVLICCAAADERLGEALAADVARAGHEVRLERRPDAPLLAQLALYDAVVAVWSDASVNSERMRRLAETAHNLGRLLPVRAALLDAGRIPQPFRDLETPLLDDVTAVLRGIARLAPPPPPAELAPPSPRFRRPAPAPVLAPAPPSAPHDGPPLPPPPDAPMPVPAGRRSGGFPGVISGRGRGQQMETAKAAAARTAAGERQAGAPLHAKPAQAQKSVETQAGKLVHKIPDRMWLGEPETVEVRLGAAGVRALTEGLPGRGGLREEDLPIVETMAVNLVAPDGAFDIEKQSETVQLVLKDALKGTGLEGASYGRWLWRVTPRKTGAHQLCVKVSAGLKDSRGVPATAALPDREFPVSVSVRTGRAAVRFLIRVLAAGGSAAGAALVGAATQEYWWPKLKALLISWGWSG